MAHKEKAPYRYGAFSFPGPGYAYSAGTSNAS